MGTYSDIRDQRYRTELDIGTSDIGLKKVESDIISDIGIKFYPISYTHKSHSGWEVSRLPLKTSVLGSNPADVISIFWISDIRMYSDVDIRTLPISEWQFSVWHSFFLYRNNICMSMSNIADIKVDVDAHVCWKAKKRKQRILSKNLVRSQKPFICDFS